MLLTVDDALALLARLGAPAHLRHHHALVAEAAEELIAGLSDFTACFDPQDVLLGAALHDVGKLLHPDEVHARGTRHEEAGRALLEAHGPPRIARFCVSHGQWNCDALALEDLLVALADKLWKGKRVGKLEQRVVATLARSTRAPAWQVFSRLDLVFESVAARGDERLLRSQSEVHPKR
ncbi:MAG: HD domain-containing protein [Nannocystales bacterium]